MKLISNISIENFIIIDHLNIDFKLDFTAVTGETGTGKSIILDAINFCFGKFTTKNIQKESQKNCAIEIKFIVDDTKKISEFLKIKLPSEIVIKKLLDKNEKVTCHLNEVKISAKLIKDLMPYLIDITAQSDSILSKSSQREILDDFLIATKQNSASSLRKISKLFFELRNLDHEISELEEELRIAKRDKAYHAQIVSELEKLDIKKDEETELLTRRSKIARLCSNNNLIKSSIDSLKSSSASSDLVQSIKNLEKVNSEITDNLKIRLESVSIELSDIMSELAEIASGLESMESELSEIDERLSVIRSVARKYNTSTSTLFEFLAESIKKLEISDNFDSKLDELLEIRDAILSKYDDIANELHSARLSASADLSSLIGKRLYELLMPNASFNIDVQKSDNIRTQYGKDDIEFLANFNKDSRLMPISQIASGGEAARLNFALKMVLGIYSDFNTIIFDEVDVGIGGAAAYAMGNAMRKLSNKNNLQIISITHSPQVSARANSHVLIKKEISGEKVNVSAKTLNDSDRITEIARMISGEEVNDAAILAAKQLLSN